jgi:hypothetical protein
MCRSSTASLSRPRTRYTRVDPTAATARPHLLTHAFPPLPPPILTPLQVPSEGFFKGLQGVKKLEEWVRRAHAWVAAWKDERVQANAGAALDLLGREHDLRDLAAELEALQLAGADEGIDEGLLFLLERLTVDFGLSRRAGGAS